jgi:hypothetical protein
MISESVGESFLKFDVCDVSLEKRNCSHADGRPDWDSTRHFSVTLQITLGLRRLIIVNSKKFAYLPLCSEVHFIPYIHTFSSF